MWLQETAAPLGQFDPDAIKSCARARAPLPRITSCSGPAPQHYLGTR